MPNTYGRANPVSRLIWKNVDCWGKKRKKVSWNSPGGTSTMCLKSWLLVERFSGIRSTQSWRAGVYLIKYFRVTASYTKRSRFHILQLQMERIWDPFYKTRWWRENDSSLSKKGCYGTNICAGLFFVTRKRCSFFWRYAQLLRNVCFTRGICVPKGILYFSFEMSKCLEMKFQIKRQTLNLLKILLRYNET